MALCGNSLVSSHVSRAVIWGITWKTVGVKLNGIGEENLQDLPGEGGRGQQSGEGTHEGKVGCQL